MRLVFILALCLNSSAWSAPAPKIMEPHSTVDGATLGEWTGRWWQWAYTMDPKADAVRDRTGAFASAGQDPNGPVWFLAGSYYQDKIDRTCKIPASRKVFFPIINICWRGKASTPGKCEELTAQAQRWTMETQELFLYVDNIKVGALEQYREETAACFSVPGFEGKTFSASGYWVMLEPLPVGKHRLRFGALNQNFSQNIEYELEAVDGNAIPKPSLLERLRSRV